MDNPNILLLTIDALRTDRVGCYGSSKSLTPNIDDLALNGLRFDQAITGGTWTQAAFPVMMTSTYASMYGGCLGPLSPLRPSPVERLTSHGYLTAGFSTNPLLSCDFKYNRGFGHFRDLYPDESDPKLRNIKGGQRLLRAPIYHHLTGLFGQNNRPARLYVSADTLAQNFCKWLNTVRGPFFAWLHFMDVHWPYSIEEKLIEPIQIAQAWRDLAYMYKIGKERKLISSTQRNRFIQLYEEAISYTDASIGQIIKYLDNIGLSKDTVIIVLSDHGEEFYEHGRWGHPEFSLFDEIIKIPLVVYIPWGAGNQVIKQQVRTLDLMPTIMDLCGCFEKGGMMGNSLLPVWSGKGDGDFSEISISEMIRDDWHRIAVRTNQYKYIWDSRNSHNQQLYNLKLDPSEKNNVIDSDTYIANDLHNHVLEVIRLKEETEPSTKVVAPDLSKDVVDRLRDLGYLD